MTDKHMVDTMRTSAACQPLQLASSELAQAATAHYSSVCCSGASEHGKQLA